MGGKSRGAESGLLAKEAMRVCRLVTFNVWGIPVGSVRTFGRAWEWGPWMSMHLGPQQSEQNDQLEVFAFQEAWSWRCGLLGWMGNWMMTLLQRCFKYCWGCLVFLVLPLSILNVLLNVLLSWLPYCIHWDTKHALANHFKHMQQIGTGVSRACNRFLDSGLLILASHPPTESGFRPFGKEAPTSCSCSCEGFLAATEAFANKGVLWAYWLDQRDDHGIIVLNTHTAAPWCSLDVKRAQITQIGELVSALKGQYETRSASFEIYLCGDFNQPGDSEDLEMLSKETGLVRVTTGVKKTHVLGKAMDHVFRYHSKWRAWGVQAPQEQVSVEPTEKTSCIPLSDHFLVHFVPTYYRIEKGPLNVPDEQHHVDEGLVPRTEPDATATRLII